MEYYLEWRKIKDFPNYWISNQGDVMSLVKKNAKIIKSRNNGRGYLLINLGREKREYVHRLVAQMFIPNSEKKLCVNHKDLNKQNNSISNLEWCSYKENMAHAKKFIPYLQKNNKNSKEIAQIKNGKIIKKWPSIHEAGRAGYIRQAINKVISGKWESHRGFQWEEVNENPDLKKIRAKKSWQKERAVLQIKNNLVINTFDSLISATKAGFHSASIRACINKKQKHAYGFQWEYANK